ncbi:hypothetical protein BH09ACT9_BH09ACT9_00400 [soil metagenome]
MRDGKIVVEQTHDAYVITIPQSAVWHDAFLMMTVKLLERYDPETKRAAYHRRLLEAVTPSPAVLGYDPTKGSEPK